MTQGRIGRRYERPRMRDFGTVLDMTAATAITGTTEDAMNKMIPIHHNPPASAPPTP